MSVPGLPRYGVPQRVTQSAVVKASPGTLMAVQLNGGTTASSLLFYNDVDSATAPLLYDVVAPCVTATNSEANTTFIDLTPLGGIPFSIGCYVALAGTSAIGFVWFASD